jgi:hypothetical protein
MEFLVFFTDWKLFGGKDLRGQTKFWSSIMALQVFRLSRGLNSVREPVLRVSDFLAPINSLQCVQVIVDLLEDFIAPTSSMFLL